MNTYNAQNPSEMLHLLFDGELESSMETPLYASLVQSEELRSELRELIAIRESIRKDVEAFTPPVSATQGVFSRLGYHPPVPPKGSPAGFIGQFKQKFWNPAVTAILASLITAFLFLNFYGNNENISTDNRYASFSKGSIAKSNVVPNVIIGQEKSTGYINNSSAKQSNVLIREKIKYVYITGSEDKTTNESILPNAIAEPQKENTATQSTMNEDVKSLLSMISPASHFTLDYGSLKPVHLLSENSNKREFILANNFYPATQKSHTLLLELKAMSGTSFPNVEFDNVSNNMFRNFSFGAFVPVSENVHLGLEGGQEPFSQEFHHVENNTLYKIEQNPVLWWLGFGVKINWQDQIDFLANGQPFLNLTLSSTKVGPYGKAIAGVQFISESGIGILLGLEGSSLVYQEQKRFYSTEKFGVTYGMFLKF